MSYLFFSSQRLDLDTVTTGFIVIGLLGALVLVAYSYFFGDSQLSELLEKALGLGRTALTISETMAQRVIPILSSGASAIATVSTKIAGTLESFIATVSSKFISTLITLSQSLANVTKTALQKIVSWGTYVTGQVAQLGATSIRAATNAALEFLAKFVELVKGFFIPVI